MDDLLPFGSRPYLVFLGLMIFSRGMDFLSTWVATPNLVLEGNPIAKKLGWKWGAIVNLALCLAFAFYAVTAIVICTTSLLVAARNFHHAWLMRSLGEHSYRSFISHQLETTGIGIYLWCIFAQAALTALIGAALVIFAEDQLIPFSIGMGLIAYSVAVAFYSTLSVWRIRRRS